MKRVLIIEDDPNLVELLEIHLSDLDCQTRRAYDGETGLRLACSGSYDLIILDLMLPRLDGIEVCRQLRAAQVFTPVMMLTAKAEELDKVLGLEIGADDYLTKPFSVREFAARARALFRREHFQREAQRERPAQQPLAFGELVIDLDLRKVSLGGSRVELSPKEFDLLVLLASSPGKSYDRKRILNLVWGYDFDGYEHTVNSHINRLRGKIEPDISRPRYILTSWGVGYRFNEEIA